MSQYQQPELTQSPVEHHPHYQQMPMHQQQGLVQLQSRYLQSTPIPALGRSAAPVDCPACGRREMTNVSFKISNSTHVWSLGFCCVFCLGCIPYLMNSLKDVQHKCGGCGVLIATWHRSGSIETHMSA
ncbi:LITAF-like zinc ribbon domain-containing protein [Hyaloscypha sp. PMI_1271]|nr:LITAF-like zinc ribbon domain-containing protein [Hyaloscypha sp. PMI_1271]